MRHWTPEERHRQSQLIRRWQPWKTAGVKTEACKKASSRNAYRPALHTPEIEAIQRYLKASQLLIKTLSAKRKSARAEAKARKRLANGKVLHIFRDAPVSSCLTRPPITPRARRRAAPVATYRLSPEFGSCIGVAGHYTAPP